MDKRRWVGAVALAFEFDVALICSVGILPAFEATHHIVATQADGPIKRDDTMKFKVENGEVKLLP